MRNSLDHFEGSLLGCAVGDALGAPYEGYWAEHIPDKNRLLARFGEFHGYPLGQYTDDTQLTLATAKAIIAKQSICPASIADEIGELWRHATVIGPGGACMEAGDNYLRTGDWRTCGAPPGQAGNGTAMRTAFLGLCFVSQPEQLTSKVASVCRITHQDTRSVAGGVGIAQLAQSLVYHPERCATEHLNFVHSAMSKIDHQFADYVLRLDHLIGRTPQEAAPMLAWSDDQELPLEKPIITPFIIPTVLASIWSVLTYSHSWADSVYQAISLGGDVDTLGAIVGAVMGAKLGASAIPSQLVQTVQSADEIRHIAKRLATIYH